MSKTSKARRIAAIIIKGINDATLPISALRMTPAKISSCWGCNAAVACEVALILQDI